ncbi:MAG: hypothetical protein CME06_10195 [Gemmatimonadetes bacterium]|nr:hypothetical protein [Gemmatimonadota bacterium]
MSRERAANEIDEVELEKIVAAIVRLAEPEKLILFGSAARGEMTPDSDLDFLVIKRGVHRRHLAREIRKSLGLRFYPIDILVVHPEDVEHYGDSPFLVYRAALEEGRVVHDAG